MCSGAYEKTINLPITKHLTPPPLLDIKQQVWQYSEFILYLITLAVKGHDIGIAGVWATDDEGGGGGLGLES